MNTISPVIVVMGVSGCGKSTVGSLLALKLNLPFYDADDYHPTENVEKMAAGLPLNDTDRQGWLEKLNKLLKEQEHLGLILACSALKESYRKILATGLHKRITWVYLKGSYEDIWQRIQARNDHFMPPALLQSQFETLEVPTYALEIDIANSPEKIVDDIAAYLK